MAGHVVVLDYNLMSKEQLQQVADTGVRDVMVQDFQWEAFEPEPGKRRWEIFDRYVSDAAECGLRPILRMERVPSWMDKGLLLQTKTPCQPAVECMISPWSEDGKALLKSLLKEFCDRYGDVATITPPQPRSEHWLWYMCDQEDGEYPCFDEAARESYGMYRLMTGRSNRLPSPYAHMKSAEDIENLADTLVWLNLSLARYWTEIYECLVDLGQRELWAGIAPAMRQLTEYRHVLSGMFGQEYWFTRLVDNLKQRGIDLNVIYYAMYWFAEQEWKPEQVLVNMYLARRFGWKVWAGAEGASNIVRHTEQSIEWGLHGLVVASPFAAWDGNGVYELESIEKALSNIKRAVEIWGRQHETEGTICAERERLHPCGQLAHDAGLQTTRRHDRRRVGGAPGRRGCAEGR